MDIAAQREFKERIKKLPLLAYGTWASSSGFAMATELRRFWYEYWERFGRYGPYALPSSFNILEAFLDFDPDFFTFLLRPERDHLLRFGDYLDWYTGSLYPEEPGSLVDIMEEGVVYSYNFLLGANEPLLSTEGGKLLLAGASLIRHSSEVAMLLLAGQNPPLPAQMEKKGENLVKEKAELQPSPDATEASRLLDGVEDYSRVLLAARFDLSNRLNDVRYLLRDLGNSYQVATDDHDSVKHALRERGLLHTFRSHAVAQAVLLRQYSDLFSAAAASLFLPAFVIDQASSVTTSEFMTRMGQEHKTSRVRRLRRELGNDYFQPRAVVCCLTSSSAVSGLEYRIEPPEMRFESTGYWKPLDAGQIGTSADGTPIVGKTWVYRTDAWESSAPDTFIAMRAKAILPNDRREEIYVARSSSHTPDIYKVGLTRRNSATRAQELSGGTSAPLPFEILASWAVDDADAMEKRIHKALAPYRLNPRREFFRLPLSEIVVVIERVLARSGQRSIVSEKGQATGLSRQQSS